MTVALVEIEVSSAEVKGKFIVGVADKLPEAVDLLLGNDIVFGVSSVNVVTRSQSKQAAQTSNSVSTTISPSNNDNTVISCKVKLDNTDSNESNENESIGLENLFEPITIDKETNEKLKGLQVNDPSLASLFEPVSDQSSLGEDRIEYFLNNKGILMRKWRDRNDTAGGGNEVIQTLMSHCFQSELLNLAQDASTSGHLGVAKTQSRLLQHFCWPNLFKDLKEYCRTCDTCQRIGKNNRKPKASLITLPIISESFKRISIDIVDTLKPTSKGCRFILTVIDHATRWPHAFPLVHHTAADIADAMMSYFTLYGFPSE